MERIHFIIITSLIVLVILYWVYLGYYKTNTIEGFDEIKLLIKSKQSSIFDSDGKIWDNRNSLNAYYTSNNFRLPNNIGECNVDNGARNLLKDCPISIWRPKSLEGYKPVGDVLTRSFMSPNLEIIQDIRKTRIPGANNDKELDTMLVIGGGLKSPLDYLYVGSFGQGSMDNVNQIKSDVGALKQNIVSNFMKAVKVYNQLLSRLNIMNKFLFDAFADQLYRFSIHYNIQSFDQDTINNFYEIYRSYNMKTIEDLTNSDNKIQPYFDSPNITYSSGNKNNVILLITKLINNIPSLVTKSKGTIPKPTLITANNTLSTKVQKIVNLLTPNNSYIQIKIEKNNITPKIQHPNDFLFNDLLKGFSQDIVDEIALEIRNKKYIFTSQQDIHTYTFKFNNLNIIPHSANNLPQSLSNILGVKPANNYKNLLPTDSRIDTQNILNINITGKKNTTDTTLDIMIDDNRNIETINNKSNLLFVNSIATNSPTSTEFTQISNYTLKLNDTYDVVSKLKTLPIQNTSLQELYDNLNNETGDFIAKNNDLSNETYRALTIWQPIPPPGYVALGCIFVNSSSRVEKPSKDLIACVPKSCAKNFKRRTWIPEDLIFRYTDDTQSLAFYRNPYLGTVVVMNEKINNSEFLNQFPNKMKYSNDPDSLNWECFDIVACIKTNNYLDKLTNATKKSKQLCRSYSKLETEFINNDEEKKTDELEENNMKKVITEKKQYIDTLMSQLDGLMSTEELYKMINRGMNRHKMQKDLTAKRLLQEKVADKMMRTRGFEISWDDTNQFNSFKDILTRFVVARNGKKPPKDCPVCKLPDNTDFVELDKLKMCYGCVEDVVRELIGSKQAAGEPIPPELQQLGDKINQ
jgi:hypothetical protein